MTSHQTPGQRLHPWECGAAERTTWAESPRLSVHWISLCSREWSWWVQYFYWLAVGSIEVASPPTHPPHPVLIISLFVPPPRFHLTLSLPLEDEISEELCPCKRRGAEYACTKRTRARIKPLCGEQVWKSSFTAGRFLESCQSGFVAVGRGVGSRFTSFLESPCCSRFCVTCILTLSSWQSWMKSRSRSCSTKWGKSSWGAGRRGKKKLEWRRPCWGGQRGADRVRLGSSSCAWELGGMQLARVQHTPRRERWQGRVPTVPRGQGAIWGSKGTVFLPHVSQGWFFLHGNHSAWEWGEWFWVRSHCSCSWW